MTNETLNLLDLASEATLDAPVELLNAMGASIDAAQDAVQEVQPEAGEAPRKKAKKDYGEKDKYNKEKKAKQRQNENFSGRYDVQDHTVVVDEETLANNGFAQFDLPRKLMANLVKMGFNTPTPIQEQSIPFAIQGRDVLGSAQTGTGKTAAFSIPVVTKLMTDPTAAALIMTPTRELATQINDVIHQLLNITRKNANHHEFSTALLIGGDSMAKQLDQLQRNPRIIVGTPGRINDHLRRNGSMLEDVQMVVLDEADRMLDMGFSVQIDEVLAKVQKPCQMLMFSATFAPEIMAFSKQYLNKPERISIEPAQRAAAKIKQETIHTTEDDKYGVLVKELDARSGSVIVFARTKHGADRLAARLVRENHAADAIHGDLRQRQRDRAIANFRAGKTRIMIATDVAARGIDVPHIEHVINYDLPQVAEDYVHRIGRTGRAGAEGNALSLLVPSDGDKWFAICRTLDPTATRQSINFPGYSDRAGRGGKGGKASSGRGAPKRGGFSGGRDRGDRGQSGEPDFGRYSSAKPAYKKEGGFNDRKRGEGYSFKKSNDDFRGNRDGGFRKERVEGEVSPYAANDRAPRGDRAERGNRDGGRFERNDRPQRDFGDRPQRSFGDRDGNRADRGNRDGGRFERNDRPQRDFGDRPQRNFGDRDGNRADRGNRDGGRFERNDRPQRDFGDRPQRSFGDRDGNRAERGNRDGGRFERNDRPQRDFGDRPQRSFGDRDGNRGPRNDRPQRDFGDRPQRSFGERNDRPQRDFADKKSKPFGGKSFGDKSFGGKSEGGNRGGKSFGGGKSSFGGGRGNGDAPRASRRGAGRFN
jgi:ATP-dependent RNA helicase DeaD